VLCSVLITVKNQSTELETELEMTRLLFKTARSVSLAARSEAGQAATTDLSLSRQFCHVSLKCTLFRHVHLSCTPNVPTNTVFRPVCVQADILSVTCCRPITVYVIAFDFSKAFDPVRHVTLMVKIASLSLPDEVYNWMRHTIDQMWRTASILKSRKIAMSQQRFDQSPRSLAW